MTDVNDSTWLATFYADASHTASASTFHRYLADFKTADEKLVIGVEVTHKASDEWLVVFATMPPDSNDGSTQLTAIIAFSNSSSRCDRLNRDGLPAFEAEFAYVVASNRLSITIQAFGGGLGGSATSQATPETFHINGLPIDAATGRAYDESSGVDVVLRFEQTLASPSPIDPGGTVQVTRSGTQLQGQFRARQVPPRVFIEIPALRYPDLSPLDTLPGTQAAARVLSGNWNHVKSAPSAPTPRSSRGARPPEPSRASLPYVPVSFRFEAVEWLGFRIDLRDTGAASGDIEALLDKMLQTLNDPHRSTPGGADADADADAGSPRFEAASTRINIDLLRYGRMRLAKPWEKLSADNYFSQHELVLRMAVRRVDDPFGREMSVHVPAIFVDNPWSRHLGRETLGFDKRMAAVYDDAGQLLRDDGCRSGSTIAPGAAHTVPLSRVRHVVLRDREPPQRPDLKTQLLGLDYGADLDRDSFIDIADDRLLTPSTMTSFAWRASAVADGDGDAFTPAVPVQRLSGFRNVQSAPIDTRPLQRAIVRSRVVFRHVQLALPDGLASLTLGAPAGAPSAWLLLQAFLDDRVGAEVTLPAGDWYHIRCDMHLDVLDPLGW